MPRYSPENPSPQCPCPSPGLLAQINPLYFLGNDKAPKESLDRSKGADNLLPANSIQDLGGHKRLDICVLQQVTDAKTEPVQNKSDTAEAQAAMQLPATDSIEAFDGKTADAAIAMQGTFIDKAFEQPELTLNQPAENQEQHTSCCLLPDNQPHLGEKQTEGSTESKVNTQGPKDNSQMQAIFKHGLSIAGELFPV